MQRRIPHQNVYDVDNDAPLYTWGTGGYDSCDVGSHDCYFTGPLTVVWSHDCYILDHYIVMCGSHDCCILNHHIVVCGSLDCYITHCGVWVT